MKRPEQCPNCNSNEVVPIKYGLPGIEMREDWLAGKIKLGGCVMDLKAGTDPKWYCKKCGHRWK
jgi:ribosomal protein L37AE/L43A